MIMIVLPHHCPECSTTLVFMGHCGGIGITTCNRQCIVVRLLLLLLLMLLLLLLLLVLLLLLLLLLLLWCRHPVLLLLHTP